MNDRADELLAAVREARETATPLYILGGDSKRHLLGRECTAQVLDVSAHRGIVDYQPAELVLTALAGTPICELVDALAARGQELPFDPPQFDGRATLGGTLACNLSGPGRPWSGSVRDMVLGVQLINGRGELLNFGGQVMKYVAGYDIARLHAGALGTLGLISRISLKVLPRPEHSLTLVQPPLSGREQLDEMLRLRLAAALIDGSNREGVAALRGRLMTGEILEVAGYGLSRDLAVGLDSLELSGLDSGTLAAVNCMEIVSEPTAGTRDGLQRAIASWKSAGMQVNLDNTVCSEFWATREIAPCPELVDGIVRRLVN